MVTDMVLTDIRGDAVARQAREIHPAMPVVYISGYAGETVMQGDVPAGDVFLRKPFTDQELQLAIEAALSATPSANEPG